MTHVPCQGCMCDTGGGANPNMLPLLHKNIADSALEPKHAAHLSFRSGVVCPQMKSGHRRKFIRGDHKNRSGLGFGRKWDRASEESIDVCERHGQDKGLQHTPSFPLLTSKTCQQCNNPAV